MTSRREKFKRSKIATIRWFVGLSVFLLAYWWVMSNYVIKDFWDPQYVMKYERLQARMKEYPGHPLWLIMGTSRVERGLRAGVLQSRLADKDYPLFFNFGLRGASLFREYICLHRLLESGIKPQRVGIEILGATLSHDIFEMADAPELLIRARADELDEYVHHSENPAEFMKYWELSRWNPAYEYGMKVSHQTLTWRLIPIPWVRYLESSTYDKWGWDPQPEAPIPESLYNMTFNVAKIQFANKFENFKISPKTDRPLRKILDMCRGAGVDVFLIKMPEGKDFHAFYTPEAIAQVDAYVAKIQKEYGVKLIDASDWIGKEGFLDGHHLNGTGAADFTRRFSEELIKTGSTQLAR